MTIRFNNSLSHRLQDFQPLQDGKAGLYTCGPTVYNCFMFFAKLFVICILAGFGLNCVCNTCE